MNRQRALKGWWAGAAIGAIALLFLAPAFCCVDQDSMDHHRAFMDFCSIAILVLALTSTAVALVFLGLAPTLGRPSFATILLPVPKPPPRRIRFS
jgi:hypothetical protein